MILAVTMEDGNGVLVLEWIAFLILEFLIHLLRQLNLIPNANTLNYMLRS